jgi:hypothetical protein
MVTVSSPTGLAASAAMRKATAVMLSSPPSCSRTGRASARPSRGRPVAVDELEDVDVLDHVGEAVGADQEDVAVLRLDRERVDVDVRVGADSARDDAALRVDVCLLLRELAALDELVHE